MFVSSWVPVAKSADAPVDLNGDVLSQFTIASYLMESGNTRGAIEYFEAAWEQSLHHPAIGTKLAEAYFNIKQFELSEQTIDEVLAVDGTSYRALLLKSRLGYLRGDLENSLENLEKLAANHGASFEIYRKLGNIYYELGSEEKALSAFKAALEYRPNVPGLQHRYGLLLLASKRLDEAEEAFRKAITLDPGFTDSAIELAGILIESGRIEEAESTLSIAVQHGRQIERALLILSTLYLETGQLDKGIQLLEEHGRQESLSRDASVILGRFYFEAKEYGEAERIFRSVFEKEESNPELAGILGDISLQSGKPEQALQYYRKAIDIEPDNYRRYLTLFFAASPKFVQNEGNRISLTEAESVDILRKAGSLIDREDFNGNYLVGICYLSIDSLDSARNYLIQAVALEPNDESSLLNLANIAERTKKFEEAESYLIKLYEQKPDDPTICNFYGYLLAKMGKNLDRAESLVMKAIEKDPANGYYIDSLGWVFFQRGEYERAVTELEKASKLVKGDPVILEHLGDAYRALKRYHDALAAYKQSEAFGSDSVSIIEKIKSTEKGLE